MKISVSISNESEFNVGMWWAKSPDFVLKTFREQLKAAQSVWPELEQYGLLKRRNRKSCAREELKQGNAEARKIIQERGVQLHPKIAHKIDNG